MTKLTFRILLLVLVAGHGNVFAQPAPYRAEYQAKANGLSATAVRSLEKTADGEYLLKNSLDLVIVGASVSRITETSRFRWHESAIRPLQYRYEQTRLGAKLEEISFDWAQQEAVSSYDDKKVEMALPDETVQDKLSFSAQLGLDLDNMDRESVIGTELSYHVLDTDEIEQQRYLVEAEETMETPMGQMPVVKIVRVRDPESQRKTTFWLAPEQDFLLVKLVQTSGDGTTTELTLSSFGEI